MLKIMRMAGFKGENLMFIVPAYWLNRFGMLKPTAIVALKVFFGELNNTQADKLLIQLEEKDKKKGFVYL